MKKTLVALAALAATASFAQSSVTLYGVADVYIGTFDNRGVLAPAGSGGLYQNATGLNINATTNVVTLANAASAPQKQTVLNTGGLSGSRFGLRGSEDLGGGLKANFLMENGHNTETGANAQGGLMFGRQAFVGLSGGFGEMRLGRQYPAYDEARGGADLFGHSSFSTTAGNGSWQSFGRDYTYRVNNAVHYISPNFAGITAAITYAMGENKIATAGAGNLTSLRVSYNNGPISAVLAHQSEKSKPGNITTFGQTDLGSTYGIRNATITGGYAPTSETHTFLSGAYDLGVARVQLAYNTSKDNNTVGIDKDKEMALNVAVPFGATTVVAGVSRSKFEDAKSTTAAIQATYALSKRTNVYGGFVNSKDKLPTNLGEFTAKRTLLGLGVRHTF